MKRRISERGRGAEILQAAMFDAGLNASVCLQDDKKRILNCRIADQVRYGLQDDKSGGGAQGRAC